MKILDKCILKQLMTYLEANKLFSKNQFGFRKYYGTSHAVVALSDMIKDILDRDKLCILVSLDIQKAFDTIDRDMLISKLKWFGITDSIFCYLLNDRYQYVENNGLKSEIRSTTAGITQGCALSSIFFLIFICDLPLCTLFSKMFLYADDSNTAIEAEPKNFIQCMELLKMDLKLIHDWIVRNKLSLNVEKSKYIIFGKSSTLQKIPKFKLDIDDKVVDRVNTMNILGVIFYENMTWKSHVNNVMKKCYMGLGMMYKLKRMLSIQFKTMLVKSLIFSHFRYCSIAWLGDNIYSMQQIDKIIKMSARFILNKRKFDHISEDICKKLGFLYADYLVKYETLTLAYKSTYCIRDGYFYEYINFKCRETLVTRTGSHVEPDIDVNGNFGKSMFRYAAVRNWIDIPQNVKGQFVHLKSFKKLIYNYLMDEQFKKFCVKNVEHDSDDEDNFDIVT